MLKPSADADEIAPDEYVLRGVDGLLEVGVKFISRFVVQVNVQVLKSPSPRSAHVSVVHDRCSQSLEM
jgi:hypothetical protein